MKTMGTLALAAGAFALAAWGCATDEEGTNAAVAGTLPGADGTAGAAGSGAGSGDGGGTTTLPDASGTADAGPAPRPYVDFTINHVLITGQSNAVANSGVPIPSTTQPFANLMFSSGVMPMAQCDGDGCRAYDAPTSFVPLIEGDRFFNYGVETASSGLANEATKLATAVHGKAGHQVLVSVHGRSGNTYACLRPGGCAYKSGYTKPFEESLQAVRDAKTLAGERSYAVRAVATVHGESDHYSYSAGVAEFPLPGTNGGTVADYGEALVEWQRDYETGIQAITGQTEPVPLLVSQISGWNDVPYSRVATWQLAAHEAAPGKVVLVTPAYFLPMAPDCKHFTGDGERWLGEYFAKAYARIVFEGRPWEPLRPLTVTRDGATVSVRFHVPTPPLVLDTERVAAAENQGFTFVDASGAAQPISAVAVTGPDTVTLTLAAPPAGGGRLWYGQNQTPGTCIGPLRGARGNLRDSDTTLSQAGYELFDWAVVFDVPVP